MLQPTRPHTQVSFDDRTFTELKRGLQIRVETRRKIAAEPLWASPLPLEVGFQVTYRCNLRCTHCYEWNAKGYFHQIPAAKQGRDLGVDVIEKVLAATAPTRAKAYFWGGEPLLHNDFGAITRLIERSPRHVDLCTNGLLLERRADDLMRLDEDAALLVSLDGLEAQHDALRGQGTFVKTVAQIRTMLDLKRKGAFRGEVSVSGMISDDSAPHLYEIIEQAEEIGVNTAYLQFPWYLSPEAARAMDVFVAEHLPWVKPPKEPSWHRYGFRMAPEKIKLVRSEIARIAARRWKIRVRYLPDAADDEVADFVSGKMRPAQQRSTCLAIANRMEVYADGMAGTCKFYPELAVGDLRTESVADVWHSDRFRALRAAVRGAGLTPVCSKCGLLYMNGD